MLVGKLHVSVHHDNDRDIELKQLEKAEELLKLEAAKHGAQLNPATTDAETFFTSIDPELRKKFGV